MADASQQSTDGASIKPVSSLRSHFENMVHSNSALPTSLARGTPHIAASPVIQERVSLDSPRRQPPTSLAQDYFTQESGLQNRRHRRSGSSPQEASSALRQRPTSISSLSSPRSSPIVRAESPQPSSKSVVIPKLHISSRHSSPAPPEPVVARTQPLHPSTLTSLHESSNVEAGPILRRENPQQSEVSKTSQNSVLTSGNQSLVKGLEKPRVPPKPSLGNTSNLEPRVVGRPGKISPFSTPPSSDESTESEKSAIKIGAARFHHPTLGNKTSYLPTRSTIPHEKDSSTSREDKQENRVLKPDAGGVVQQPQLSHDQLHSRPGLPPRRQVNPKIHEILVATPAPKPTLQRSWTDQRDRQRIATSKAHTRVSSMELDTAHPIIKTSVKLPPPRSQTYIYSNTQGLGSAVRSQPNHQVEVLASKNSLNEREINHSALNDTRNSFDYPDISRVNRRPPYTLQGVRTIETGYDTKLFDISYQYVCTTGYLTKAWDLRSGETVMNLIHGEREVKITAIAFKSGTTVDDEGLRLWLGTNYGDLHEADIPTQKIILTKSAAHNRREIVKIFRYQNAMWTLDDDGRLYIWPPDNSGLPSLHSNPISKKLPRGHSFSITVQHTLWLANGKDIRVFFPNSEAIEFSFGEKPLHQPGAGEVTSGAVIPSQLNRVYFGHADGKITCYSAVDFSLLGIFNVSAYKINALAGAGSYLWAGYSTGMIYVYDTATQPWTLKKDWLAHQHPIVNILVDRSSLWRSGTLRVASIGTDNAVRLWDGTLEHDWLEGDMQDHDSGYCSYRNIKAVVVTWNAGASTPTSLRYNENSSGLFASVIRSEAPPDILVFGFQELVDLEDKKLTAKSFFRGNKKKDSSEQEHMSHQYRAWRDYLVRCVEDNMPSNEPYHLLHTASMVGLFSCVFVKSSQRTQISHVDAGEVKRGLGGLHGNKGALVLRFLIDDSSVCLVNCHLAAGQSQTIHRNNDAVAILESAVLPLEDDSETRCDCFVGGGDGSMILDHEMCILNGDLNYRIDTMGRDAVIKAVNSGDFERLLERDQLLVSRRRNPLFRLRAFSESPVSFAPTYKYDIGSDQYDTSEKHRAPAWCDRILYRGPGKIHQLEYRRHELRISDHRPVSATFAMRIKKVRPDRRDEAWAACMKRFDVYKQKISNEAKIIYLRDILGVNAEEARAKMQRRDPPPPPPVTAAAAARD